MRLYACVEAQHEARFCFVKGRKKISQELFWRGAKESETRWISSGAEGRGHKTEADEGRA